MDNRTVYSKYSQINSIIVGILPRDRTQDGKFALYFFQEMNTNKSRCNSIQNSRLSILDDSNFNQDSQIHGVNKSSQNKFSAILNST
jgi:hypothetical protein